MKKVKISTRILPLIFFVSIIAIPDISLGQVTYRATEDALKQLIKDIEKVRKAPANAQLTEASGGKNTVSKDTYRIKKGDTLNQIIDRNLSSSPITHDILKMSIVKANRHAFKRNNPNWMYAGKVIKFPTVSDLKNLLFKNQAMNASSRSSTSDTWVQFP